MVRRPLELAHEVARDEDGPALGRERPKEPADPHDALGVQAVDRLIQDQGRRISEERRGDAEPLGHPERVAAGASATDTREPDELEDLVDARSGDIVALRQPQEVVAGPTPRVRGGRVQERPDLMEGEELVPVRFAAHRRHPRVGRGQPKDQAHRRALAGAVRADEAGHATGGDREGQVIDRDRGAVPFREASNLDRFVHATNVRGSDRLSITLGNRFRAPPPEDPSALRITPEWESRSGSLG